jgi:hypothetical protein
MADTNLSGVFILQEVRERILASVWPDNFVLYVAIKNHGWFGGGSPGPKSRVERINFNNDTVTALVKGPLSFGRTGLTATGNDNFGWFGGGSPGPGVMSTVDRINFADDTATASVRGPLSLARNNLAATGNDNFGWFGNGETSVPSNSTRVDRITFASDTDTATARGPLSLARIYLTATGNDNFGWFGGGLPARSTVDRITFASDTGTAPARGPLSLARNALASTGNDDFGWFGGGNVPASPAPFFITTVDRITFASDTGTAPARGPLSSGRHRLAATGNDNFGWFAGGANPTFPSISISLINRITYSSDTSTASVRGPFSSDVSHFDGTSGII